MVQGYDERGGPHIFTVDNPGKCEYYDKIGFWAIGSGQHQAVASLFLTEYDRFKPLEECVARVLAAKLAAESASGVGKKTWLMVHRKTALSKTIFASMPLQAAFRKKWEVLPRFPVDMLPEIKKEIDAAAKDHDEEVRQEQSPNLPGPSSAGTVQ